MSESDASFEYAEFDEISTNGSDKYSGADYAVPSWNKSKYIEPVVTDFGLCVLHRNLPTPISIKLPDGTREKTTIPVRTKIELYATSASPGATIRMAVSGDRKYGMVVGSRSENMFFKVLLGTGELGTPNYSNTFFFQSPEEYETVFHSPLKSKLAWREKRDAEYKYREQLDYARKQKRLL